MLESIMYLQSLTGRIRWDKGFRSSSHVVTRETNIKTHNPEAHEPCKPVLPKRQHKRSKHALHALKLALRVKTSGEQGLNYPISSWWTYSITHFAERQTRPRAQCGLMTRSRWGGRCQHAAGPPSRRATPARRWARDCCWCTARSPAFLGSPSSCW